MGNVTFPYYNMCSQRHSGPKVVDEVLAEALHGNGEAGNTSHVLSLWCYQAAVVCETQTCRAGFLTDAEGQLCDCCSPGCISRLQPFFFFTNVVRHLEASSYSRCGVLIM